MVVKNSYCSCFKIRYYSSYGKGDLDTILLDEPTIHLDSFRRHELINLLKDMTVLPQMIIVTHESQLENAADNLVKVEK